MPDKNVLRQLISLPLDAKVVLTQKRIREWYEHWNGDVCVNFSGGKDSTVLAHLVHEMYPDVPLVFSNTGLEYPEIQKFARKMGAVFIRPKMPFAEVITKYGYPVLSKEISEAIYYARRIRNGKTEKWHRIAFEGKRQYGYKRSQFQEENQEQGYRDYLSGTALKPETGENVWKRKQLMGTLEMQTRRKQLKGEYWLCVRPA